MLICVGDRCTVVVPCLYATRGASDRGAAVEATIEDAVCVGVGVRDSFSLLIFYLMNDW